MKVQQGISTIENPIHSYSWLLVKHEMFSMLSFEFNLSCNTEIHYIHLKGEINDKYYEIHGVCFVNDRVQLAAAINGDVLFTKGIIVECRSEDFKLLYRLKLEDLTFIKEEDL